MHIRNTDRYNLAEAYTSVRECECQHAAATTSTHNSSEDRVDMILNNLVNLNNKAAELVHTMQDAVNGGEEVEEWVSEKIAVAANMIGTINDYYAKFKNNAQPATAMQGSAGLNLQPSTVASSFPLKTNMPPVTIAI